MAVGRCYPTVPNGNSKGTIHWDFIKNMKLPGSEVYFDDQLILRN